MTPDNFNWFLHTMLFYHSQRVIQKQAEAEEEEEEEEDGGGDNGGDSDSDD
jgi:hypothetical protein